MSNIPQEQTAATSEASLNEAAKQRLKDWRLRERDYLGDRKNSQKQRAEYHYRQKLRDVADLIIKKTVGEP